MNWPIIASKLPEKRQYTDSYNDVTDMEVSVKTGFLSQTTKLVASRIDNQGMITKAVSDILSTIACRLGDLARQEIVKSSVNCVICVNCFSSGVDGQGSLSERMLLKERLEEGCWIVDTPAPPGASLWLIRHFIGRLPDPLLSGEHWRQLASECSVAIQHMHATERTVCPVHKLIARSLSSIRKEEYLILAALFKLVHDLSMDRKSGHLNWVAIKSLVQYFTPSLVTRPFIPGLTTEVGSFLVFIVNFH
uniref:Uncharacterized protein n=1 Tax=Timema bartmani TaxID=61472 RepID=A0A7R9EW96_9NEOP|nr:unnamed protein product [Timema bartmani]